MAKKYSDAEKRAIEANPDLPPEVAAAFAEELEELNNFEGMIPSGVGFAPADPGSVREMFPHLRDPRFI